MTFRLLFHVPLSAPNSRALFFRGALERFVEYFSKVSSDFELDYFGPERFAPLFVRWGFRDCSVSETSIRRAGLYKDYQKGVYEARADFLDAISQQAEAHIDKPPHLIVGWETPLKFFHNLYKDAVLLHLMPAPTSRAPFGERVVMDPLGLFKDSALSKVQEEVASSRPGVYYSRQQQAAIRSRCFLETLSPFRKFIQDLRWASDDPIYLLPLQNRLHYVYQSEFGEMEVLDVIDYFRSQLPPHAKIVLTQYHTGEFPRQFCPEEMDFIKFVVPSVVYDSAFESTDSAAQYIWPFCDGVANLSSGVGLQAWLHEKPVLFHPKSYLRFLNNENANTDQQNALRAFAQSVWTRPINALIDPRSLRKLLREFVARRGEQMIMERFPISSDTEAMELFTKDERVIRAATLLGRQKDMPAKVPSLGFERSIRTGSRKLVSFDIFDTLLERTLDSPHSVFLMVEHTLLKQAGAKFVGFARARVEAERACRAGAPTDPEKEISLAAIYEKLERFGPWTADDLIMAHDQELRVEGLVVRSRLLGRTLFDRVRECGLDICFASDMYLPKHFVEQLLASAGYPPGVQCFVSSESGFRKHDGELFRHLSQVKELDFSQILHVGDNSVGDEERPMALGIGTYRVPSGQEEFGVRMRLMNDLLRGDSGFKSPFWAVAVGLFQRRYFSDGDVSWKPGSLASGDPEAFGYVVLAPFLISFCHWLNDVWQRQYADRRVLFLARDGRILRDVASILFPNLAENSRYVNASRTSAVLAGLRSSDDLRAVCRTKIASATVRDLLLQKFHLEPSELQENGFLDQTITGDADRAPLIDAAMQHAEVILAKAAAHRLLYEGYLKDALGGRAGLVVDVGYAGSMQRCIRSLSGADVAGAYFLTFPEARAVHAANNEVHGWLGNFVERRHATDAISRYGFFMEAVITDTADTFLRYEAGKQGRPIPVFSPNQLDSSRKRVVRAIHSGVLAFARDFGDVGIEAKYVGLEDRNSVQRVLLNFLKSPTATDAAIFEGVAFEDGFGGAAVRYLVPSRAIKKEEADRKAVWVEGHVAFRKDLDPSPAALTPKKHLFKIEKGINTRHSWELRILDKFLSPSVKRKLRLRRKAYFSESKHRLLRLYGRTVPSD